MQSMCIKKCVSEYMCCTNKMIFKYIQNLLLYHTSTCIIFHTLVEYSFVHKIFYFQAGMVLTLSDNNPDSIPTPARYQLLLYLADSLYQLREYKKSEVR